MDLRPTTSAPDLSRPSTSALTNIPSSSRTLQPPMVSAPDDTDSNGSRSARGTPTQRQTELPRPPVASKGGCWTCRLRRKKCDEQRVGESCQTCVRLRIECLGWGSRRPDWMRNKQAVEQYKAEIKAQLTRAGLIRGQPRSSPPQGATRGSRPYPPPRTASSANLSSRSSRPYPIQSGTSAPLQSRSSRPYPTSTSPPAHMPSSHIIFDSTTTLDYAMPDHNETSPASPLLSEPHAEPITYIDYPNNPLYPHSPALSASPLSSATTSIPFSPRPIEQYNPGRPSLSPLSQTPVHGEHVLYYFEHVSKLQYTFARSSVNNIIYSMIVQELQGAVTNAVCALANLHYTRDCAAQGLSPVGTNSEQSTARYFYDHAFYQLAANKQLNGRYTECDVIAALQLVSYSLFSGGVVDWEPVLAIACDWLGQTGLVNDDNPKLTLINMSVAARFAVKVTMWMDIFASLSLLSPPRYLALYRRLLTGGGGLWPSHDDSFDLRMESLFGCPDEALLTIAEVSTLAHWKMQEKHNGCLSVRELIRRGEDIEQQLRQHLGTHAGELMQIPLRPPKLLPISLTQAPASTSTLGSEFSAASSSDHADEDTQYLVAEIFRRSATLYLDATLSDFHPGVPEIRASVDAIDHMLGQLPVSEVYRSLVFPICLAGCLANDPSQRDAFRGRLQALDGSIGSFMQIRTVMEAVWQRRDAHGGAIDWRAVMQEQGLNLLLV